MPRISTKTTTVVNELQEALRETEKLLTEAASAGSDQAEKLYERVADTLSRSRARLSELEAAAFESAKNAARATQEYVHENPWQSVGLGLAAGVVFGFLMARR